MRKRLRELLLVVGVSLMFGGAILLLIYSVCGLLSLIYTAIIGG